MIPITTTTVATYRRSAGDLRDAGAYVLLATGIGAHVSGPSGVETVIGGSSERIDAVLLAETCELAHDDRVEDLGAGETFDVSWVQHRHGLGLDHTKAGLVRVTDRVSV